MLCYRYRYEEPRMVAEKCSKYKIDINNWMTPFIFN